METLSDKRKMIVNGLKVWEEVIPAKDVKEFIRKLKEERVKLFKKIHGGDNGEGLMQKRDWDIFMINCDELAGDKLT